MQDDGTQGDHACAVHFFAGIYRRCGVVLPLAEEKHEKDIWHAHAYETCKIGRNLDFHYYYFFYLFYLLEIILYPRIGFKSLLFFIFEIYIVCICIDRPRLSISVQRYKFDVTA